jgi:hypothetical protein
MRWPGSEQRAARHLRDRDVSIPGREQLHLTCDAVTVHVPVTTPPVVGVQTVIYIADANGHMIDVVLDGGGVQLGDPVHTFSYDPVADASRSEPARSGLALPGEARFHCYNVGAPCM